MNELVIRLLLVYLALSNLLSLSLFGIDKWKAKHTKWRISEKTLLLVAAIGGSIGAWVGMKLWHHKTQHKKFKYGNSVNSLLGISGDCQMPDSFLEKRLLKST